MDDDGGLVSGWTITLQRYPQIDDPVTPEARAWNAYIAAENTTPRNHPLPARTTRKSTFRKASISTPPRRL